MSKLDSTVNFCTNVTFTYYVFESIIYLIHATDTLSKFDTLYTNILSSLKIHNLFVM